MKKILLICLFSCFLFADTTSVNGNVDGVWSQSGSPYVITNNLVIQPDDTLIIEPGTEILFDGHYRIDVFGLLLAVGTEEDSIIFNSLNSPDLSDSNYANSEDSMNLDIKDAREQFEKKYLIYNLQKFKYNVSKMSDAIGMERTALYRKIKLLNINTEL